MKDFSRQSKKSVKELVIILNKKKIQEPDYVFIRQDHKLVKVKFEDIQYIEAEKDFSMVFLKEKKLLAGMHLKMFEDMLPVNNFMRVHRSFIINTNQVTAITGNMVEIGKSQIPIGGSYKEDLMKRLRLS